MTIRDERWARVRREELKTEAERAGFDAWPYGVNPYPINAVFPAYQQWEYGWKQAELLERYERDR